ncbi:probable transcriptional regulator SLK2 [Rutidosis leptorrhynchoides]|uniref:probable transcriptional regulator SLK2 n=1 Tax=Rutidosis leptorrhynchoides TaxID=125765 RepID=UPI003A9A42EF
MRLPTSPMSFTSNNISISGLSVVDGSSVMQSGEPNGQQQHQGVSTATSLNASQPPLGGSRVAAGTFVQDHPNNNNISHLHKKPRLDIKQEDILQQQMLQQLLQRPDSMQQLQGRNPQVQAFIQQQRLRQQQQFLQSMPPLQRAHLQQQQQMQLRQQQMQQQQQGMMQPITGVKRPHDSGVCARRLMQYLYHQRQRPPDNTIAYWRKFVAEYYSPRAKKRWCLSLYDNVGDHALGVFRQAAMDAWHCDICGSKSGRGFEATYEVLPRLNEIKFGSGVIDELLFLDLPREVRFSSGLMMLEYGKAVQESVYEQLRVVREGQLRIMFTHDLKMLSWEFCARRHEELLPRKLVAPQVNQLLQVAQKCQTTMSEAGSDGVSQQDWQTNSNMVLSAGRQLAKSLELQSLNDLGFSKRYVRCLQISEVVNSMKDLIDFCREQKAGPIEGLKSYPRHAKMQEMEQRAASVQGLPTDRNTLNKLMAMHHPGGMNNNMNNNNNYMVGGGRGSAQAALALSNYQNMLIRQNSMNSNNPNSISIQQEATSSSFNNNSSSIQTFQGGPGSSFMPNIPGSGFSTQPQRSLSAQSSLHQHNHSPSRSQSSLHQQNHSPSSSHPLQQQMIQQLLHEMSNNNNTSGNGGVQGQQQQQSLSSGQVRMSTMGNGGPMPASPSFSGAHVPPSRSNSFRGPTKSDSSAGGGGNHTSTNNQNGYNNQKVVEENLHLCEELVNDIAHEFSENGFFNTDLDDNSMTYPWKG